MASVEIRAKIEIEIYCQKCGEALEATSYNSASGWEINVETCEKCMKKAEDKGYLEGWDTKERNS